jgi:hypothetical protein
LIALAQLVPGVPAPGHPKPALGGKQGVGELGHAQLAVRGRRQPDQDLLLRMGQADGLLELLVDPPVDQRPARGKSLEPSAAARH